MANLRNVITARNRGITLPSALPILADGDQCPGKCDLLILAMLLHKGINMPI